jgi:hypothetical protein
MLSFYEISYLIIYLISLASYKFQQAHVSTDSDWLLAGRSRGWSLSPDRDKHFHFYVSSKAWLVLGIKHQGREATAQLQLVPRSRGRAPTHPRLHGVMRD